MKIIDINGNPRKGVGVAMDKDWPGYLANFKLKVTDLTFIRIRFTIYVNNNKGILYE